MYLKYIMTELFKYQGFANLLKLINVELLLIILKFIKFWVLVFLQVLFIPFTFYQKGETWEILSHTMNKVAVVETDSCLLRLACSSLCEPFPHQSLGWVS